MLGLTLREEFRGKRLKGTAIELSNDTNTGATQIAAKEFLEITRKLPLIPDTRQVELSGIFSARRFHEEVEVQRGADRLDPQAG